MNRKLGYSSKNCLKMKNLIIKLCTRILLVLLVSSFGDSKLTNSFNYFLFILGTENVKVVFETVKDTIMKNKREKIELF
jgi:hypothetical protein